MPVRGDGTSDAQLLHDYEGSKIGKANDVVPDFLPLQVISEA